MKGDSYSYSYSNCSAATVARSLATRTYRRRVRDDDKSQIERAGFAETSLHFITLFMAYPICLWDLAIQE